MAVPSGLDTVLTPAAAARPCHTPVTVWELMGPRLSQWHSSWQMCREPQTT